MQRWFPGFGRPGGKTQITFLTNNDPNNVTIAEAVIKAFEAENTDIDVKLDTRPGGSEGDNLVKTRLSTGDMADIFEYNSGSLFQAIAPQTNLTPVTDESWVADLDDTFKEVVTADGEVYGSPWQNITGGGIFYNIPLYKKLGLEVPTTWDEFMANNAKIKADGSAAPVEQTFGDTWTSQILVLADYHNVEAANPGFADEVHQQRGEVRHHPRGAGRVRASPGAERGRLPERGLRLGEVQRRPRGGRHRQGGALSDDHVRDPRHLGCCPGQRQRRRVLRTAWR